MFRAYKMRIFPTEEQKVLIAKTFGCCRWYGKGIQERYGFEMDLAEELSTLMSIVKSNY